MNNTEAKFILRSYRDNGADANDPAFREALEQAEHDPALKAWLQSERESDEVLRAKLADTPVPDTLLDDILAAKSVSGARSHWHFGARWLAMAAALLVMLGGMLLFGPTRQPDVSFEAYPQMASAFLSRPFTLDHRASSVEEAKEWLRSHQSQWDVSVPANMQAGATTEVGCRPVTWRGKEAYLLCFFQDDGSVVHYFVMDVDALPDVPANETPMWARHGKYMTATWADDRHAYVLASDQDMTSLQTLL